ncbi:hypothetical protein RCCGEPOP_24467 [Rhizobium sp. Pop5]|nr:hypothetical protein RCCGEPOP_24467 [Rhizobium sp. Pop5]
MVVPPLIRLPAPLPGLSHWSQPVLRTPAGEKRICRTASVPRDALTTQILLRFRKTFRPQGEPSYTLA